MIPLEQRKTLTSHLNKTWKKHECDRCLENQWNICGYVSLVLTNSPTEQLNENSPPLPTAALICKNCGNTLLINMKISGADTQ